MWPSNWSSQEKQALFWGFQHTFMGLPGRYVYSQNECFPIYLLGTPINVCWNPQNRACFSEVINLRCHMPRFTLKMNIFPSISLATFQHIYGVSNKIDGKTFIFRVNLGMWPLKSIISEKQMLYWGFQNTFMGFPRRQIGKPRHVTPQIDRLGKMSPLLRVSTHIYWFPTR